MFLNFTRKNVLTLLIVILILATLFLTSCGFFIKEQPAVISSTNTPPPMPTPTVEPPQFKEFDRVQELMCGNNEEGFQGYKDKNGWVIEPKYISVRNFSEGLAAVAISHDTEADLLKQQGLSDKDIKKALLDKGIDKTLVYNMIEKAREYKHPDLWGFVDISCNVMIHPQYKRVSNFKNGLAFVEEYSNKEDKYLYHYIDKMGKNVITLEWDDLTSANDFEDDGTAVINRGGLAGVIDREGNVVLPFEYAELQAAIDGYRPAKALEKHWNKHWGIINAEGKWFIEPKYNDIRVTRDNHILVDLSDGEINGNGIIKLTGKWAVEPREFRILTSDCDMLIYSERNGSKTEVPLQSLYDYGGVKLLGEKSYQGIEIVNKDVVKCQSYTIAQGMMGARYQFVRTDGMILINGLVERRINFLGKMLEEKIGVLDNKRIVYSYVDKNGRNGEIVLDNNTKLVELLGHTGIEYFKMTNPIPQECMESISLYDGNNCKVTISDGDYYILINFYSDNGTEQYISQKPRNFNSFEFLKTAFKD